MFAQYIQSKEKSDRKREHHKDSHSQREEGVCSNPCYTNSYTSSLKHYHKPRNLFYPIEPQVGLLFFYEN